MPIKIENVESYYLKVKDSFTEYEKGYIKAIQDCIKDLKNSCEDEFTDYNAEMNIIRKIFITECIVKLECFEDFSKTEIATSYVKDKDGIYVKPSLEEDESK